MSKILLCLLIALSWWGDRSHCAMADCSDLRQRDAWSFRLGVASGVSALAMIGTGSFCKDVPILTKFFAGCTVGIASLGMGFAVCPRSKKACVNAPKSIDSDQRRLKEDSANVRFARGIVKPLPTPKVPSDKIIQRIIAVVHKEFFDDESRWRSGIVCEESLSRTSIKDTISSGLLRATWQESKRYPELAMKLWGISFQSKTFYARSIESGFIPGLKQTT